MSHEVQSWWSAWAKSVRDPSDYETVVEWLPLHVHLADTAATAEQLVEHWVPRLVVERVAGELSGSVEDVTVLLRWLAAVHDVGKVSPAFVCQVPALTGTMRDHGLVVGRGVAEDPQRRLARHERVGARAVRDALVGWGVDTTPATQIASIVGAHHGVPPTKQQLVALQGFRSLLGTGAWQSARGDALDWAAELVGGPEALARLMPARLSLPSQVLCSAIVIMADWIASSEHLFGLQPAATIRARPTAPNPASTRARVSSAWSELGLPRQWRPEPVSGAAEVFEARFGRPAMALRPSQRAAVDATTKQDRPGLVIVEAPMGEGKTEAALLAAEALAARSGAGGCFVALPTRATSDAMFRRVLRWMRALPGLPADASVMLAHGTSALNEDYRGLANAARIAAVGEGDGDEVGVAHRWLRGRKRGPLAQFVVGTVDQILLAALRSRHLMLRHLALAGKVVIIDEVHAYDVYMSRYLDRALHWLGAYGTPVVLLSATLPAARRRELVRAYESGTRPSRATGLDDAVGYPLITATDLGSTSVPAATDDRTVRVEHLTGGGLEDPGDLEELVALLREALGEGGCAVVVRNTVARVQATADRLVEEFGDDDVMVAHSRFLAVDRARLDAELLHRFGPPEQTTERPHRHIVVASQVVEQSLDVDFDLMVTDLAPVDLVLQRAGRLHRHLRSRPARLTRPRLILAGVDDWSAAPVRAVAGSRRVYGDHLLLRSAALLVDRDTITLPADISPLVQAAYDDEPLGPAPWRGAMAEARRAWDEQAEQRRDRAGKFLLGEAGGPDDSLYGWLQADVGDGEDERDTRFIGQVRDGAESLEVLVIQRDRDRGLLVADWTPGGGSQIPVFGQMEGRLARQIGACALRLPVGMSQLDPVGDGVVAALERNRYESFDQDPLLAKQLVLELDEQRRAELHHGAAHFRLTYDLRRGLLVERLRQT